MQGEKSVKKGANPPFLPLFLLLFLPLCGCAPSFNGWQLQHIEGLQCYRAKCLSYRPACKYGEVGITFANYTGVQLVYVSVYQGQLYSPKRDQIVPLILQTPCETFQLKGFLLEGGQRVLLEHGSADLLCQVMRSEWEVILQVGCYRTIINPKAIRKLWGSYESTR